MLKEAVLLCWQPHGHGQDGVTMLLPADLLQGAEGQHSRVGWCTLAALSTSTGS